MTSPLRGLAVGAVPDDIALKGGISTSNTDILPHGPDREELGGTSFPSYCILEDCAPVAEIYTRCILSFGHGFGLHDVISTSAHPQENSCLGALLGDVGFMNKYGGFSPSFNIFHHKAHRIQPPILPEDFVPFNPPHPSDDASTETPDYFSPGEIMASQGIQVKIVSESPLKVEFVSSAREAAVLILPTGGSREDLINPSEIYPYVRENAAKWYKYWNGKVDKITDTPFANGTLWVVIGVDRADSWAMATLPSDESRLGKQTEFLYKQESESEFTWESSGGCRPHFQNCRLSDGETSAIFLRLLSVAISPDQWAENVAFVPNHHIPHYSVLPTLSLGLRAWIRQLFLNSGGTTPSSDGESIFFYPPLTLLHIMLLTTSGADVGLVPDSVWISQLNEQLRHLTHPEVVRLIRRVIEHHDIVTTDGVATFIPKSKVPTRRTALTTYVARFFPWLSNTSNERRGIALQNMFKVLGI